MLPRGWVARAEPLAREQLEHAGARALPQLGEHAGDMLLDCALAPVQPGGEDAAKALGRLLGLKNDAEYGLATVSRANRELALRQANKLVEFAAAVVNRD